MKQLFILGINPALSVAEIIAVAKRDRINYKIIAVCDQFLILDLIRPMVLESLGGTVKIGEVIDETAEFDLELFIGAVLNELKSLKLPKVWFGFSFYGQAKPAKEAGMMIKKRLALDDIACRFVVSRDRQLSSVIVKKEHLLDKGRDFIVATHNGQTYLGKTTEVQEFVEYGERDFGRPGRDTRSGMLPPKLAKMMINLTQTDFADLLIDPFCGSGTILQEAMLLGYQNICGSDLSSKAVADSQRNINWLKTKNLSLAEKSVKIFNSDVLLLDRVYESQSVQGIATEPYLGPALRAEDRSWLIKNGQKVSQLTGELENLYSQALRVLGIIAAPRARLVMVWPQWHLGGQEWRLNLLSAVAAAGWQIINPLDEVIYNFSQQTNRNTILYGRAGQAVNREIVVMEKR